MIEPKQGTGRNPKRDQLSRSTARRAAQRAFATLEKNFFGKTGPKSPAGVRN